MSYTEDKKAIIQSIALKKRSLLLARINKSSGESSLAKSMKFVRKDIARLFTKLNKK